MLSILERGGGTTRPIAAQGALTSGDQLEITWALTASYVGLPSLDVKSLTVDGTAVTSIFGPYASHDAHTTYWSGTFGPLAAGSRSYTIIVTDARNNTTRYDGTFEVQPSPLTISSVVVTQNNPAARDGVMKTTDRLTVTWAVSDLNWSISGVHTVASRSLTVNGLPVTSVSGPFASGMADTEYWQGVFGPLMGGTHTYTIRVTDAQGNAASYTNTFVVKSTPTISLVAVAERDPSKRDGVLTSSEQLVITWALTDPFGVASNSLAVNGHAVSGDRRALCN